MLLMSLAVFFIILSSYHHKRDLLAILFGVYAICGTHMIAEIQSQYHFIVIWVYPFLISFLVSSKSIEILTNVRRYIVKRRAMK